MLGLVTNPGMHNRFIAVLLLASFANWSMPASLASSLQVPKLASAAAQSRAGHDHSCCPGVHSQLSLISVALVPASMPCGSQHPCCAKSAPENPPSLPTANTVTSPGFIGVLVAIEKESLRTRSSASPEALGRDAFEFYSVRSTVLRI